MLVGQNARSKQFVFPVGWVDVIVLPVQGGPVPGYQKKRSVSLKAHCCLLLRDANSASVFVVVRSKRPKQAACRRVKPVCANVVQQLQLHWTSLPGASLLCGLAVEFCFALWSTTPECNATRCRWNGEGEGANLSG